MSHLNFWRTARRLAGQYIGLMGMLVAIGWSLPDGWPVWKYTLVMCCFACGLPLYLDSVGYISRSPQDRADD